MYEHVFEHPYLAYFVGKYHFIPNACSMRTKDEIQISRYNFTAKKYLKRDIKDVKFNVFSILYLQFITAFLKLRSLCIVTRKTQNRISGIACSSH